MHGNVWEWCQDWFAEDYYKKTPETDPQGPDTGSFRVLRSGSWNFSARLCRSACRGGFTPSFRNDYLGFRVARSFEEKQAG